MDIFDIKTDVCNITHEGKVRPKNEDNQGYTNTVNGHIFVVCDGMGGHVGGQVASNIAVESIIEYFISEKKANIYEAMREAIENANRNIYERSRQDTSLKGMGTTGVLLIIKGESAYIAHVGDSRIYLHSDGKLHRITKDHSYVQSLVDNNTISDDDAENHPRKNELMRALGISMKVDVEVAPMPIAPKNGDIFLLCSDGLNGMVNDMTMEATLNKKANVQQKGEELLQFALNAGGKDNITLSLIEISKSHHNRSIFVSKSPVRKEIPKTDPDIKVTQTLNGDEFNQGNTYKKEINANQNIQKNELISNNTQQKTQENNSNDKKRKLAMLLGSVVLVLLVVAGLFFSGILTKKPYQLIIIDGKTKKEIGYFTTLSDAKEEGRNYIEEKKLDASFEVWLHKNKSASLECSENPNDPVIPQKDSKQGLTQNNKVVRIQAGTGWNGLYEDYGVCKCYIIKANPRESFGKDFSLKANEVYTIPLEFSSKIELNPKSYQDFLPSKVGYINGECTKIDNECSISSKNSTKITDNKTETTTEEKKEETITDNKIKTTTENKNGNENKEVKKELTPAEKKTAAQTEYDAAKLKHDDALKAYNEAKQEYTDITAKNNPLIQKEDDKGKRKDDEYIAKLKNERTQASNKFKAAETAEKTAKTALENAKKELDKY